MIRGGAAVAAAGGLAGLGYYLVVTGKLTIDTGWGRRVRLLGPFGVEIAAPATTVFDVIAAPATSAGGSALCSWWLCRVRLCPVLLALTSADGGTGRQER